MPIKISYMRVLSIQHGICEGDVFERIPNKQYSPPRQSPEPAFALASLLAIRNEILQDGVARHSMFTNPA